jgi:hypothetical protein
MATPVAGGQRNYTCAVGSTLDVPDYDVQALVNAGWAAVALVGPTSTRPQGTAANCAPNKPAGAGMLYVDTTLNAVIVCDGGLVWRNPVTGAAV